MSKYLLDTNVLIYLSKPSSPFHAPIVKRLSTFDGTVMVAVSALSFYELEYGVAMREAQGIK